MYTGSKVVYIVCLFLLVVEGEIITKDKQLHNLLHLGTAASVSATSAQKHPVRPPENKVLNPVPKRGLIICMYTYVCMYVYIYIYIYT